MVRQSATVIILEIIAGLVILLIVAFVALAIRLSAGPIGLDFFKSDIEATFAANRNGRATTLENISLEWLSEEQRAVITASNLQLFGDDGEVAAEAANAEILLDISRLLVGQVRPIGFVLNDGWIGVRQSETGWSVAGDPIGGQQVFPEAEGRSAQDWLHLTNVALVDVLGVLKRDADALPLEQVRFSDVDIILSHYELGERGRLSDTHGGFERNVDGISLTVEGVNVTASEAGSDFKISLNAPGDYSQISANVLFADWSLETVAGLFPSLAGRVIGLPADLTVGATASAQSGLSELRFEASAGAGSLGFNETRYPVGRLDISGEYLPDEDQLNVRVPAFDAGPAKGDIVLTVGDLFGDAAQRPFTLKSKFLELDLTKQFPEVWSFDQLDASGSFEAETLSIALRKASLGVGEAQLTTSGAVRVLRDLQPGDMPVELDLDVDVTGPLFLDDVMRFWPLKQAPPARAAVARIVKVGHVTDATATVALRRKSFQNKVLANEAVTADFNVAEGRLEVLRDIPAYENVTARGHMTGNTLSIKFFGGQIRDWKIEGGELRYPQLAPQGGDMLLDINGKGPAASLLQMLSESRLKFEERTGFSPTRVTGEAEMAFSLARPARPNVPIEEYRYTGKGQVIDAGLSDLISGLSLTGSTANVELSEKGIRVAGEGDVAGSSAEYDWSTPFRRPGEPGELKAKTLLTPDILNAFGITGRAYLTGEAPVEIEILLDGARPRSIDAAIDLLGARLDVSELGWVKRRGEVATASVRYKVEDDRPSTIARLDADKANFEVDFTLEENGKLVSANIERFFVDGLANLQGTAQRTDTDGLLFSLNGPFLDLSNSLPGLGTIGTAPSSEENALGDVQVRAMIDRLRLREGFDTTEVSLSVDSSDAGVQTIEADGQLPNGADFTAAYDASGLGDPRFLLTSGDASFLASVFLGFDSLEGGTLEMSGTLPGDDEPTQVRLVIENGRLKDAPFFTQVLSLASIRGLSDTLAGDGVLFAIAELPLLIDDGRFIIAGARASGPALGLTANGVIVPEKGEIDIDGVLVPSFGLNSALGGLPVIGDLFVSRRGEGLISLRYGVEGTFSEAQVSVNPLSAITPGVLRRIFENPEDDELIPLAGDEGSKETREPKPDE